MTTQEIDEDEILENTEETSEIETPKPHIPVQKVSRF